MADQDITRQNIVKLRPATSENAVVPVRPQFNISALARQHGLSRQTIRRRLATGWQPPRAPQVEIIESNQGVATLAIPPGHGRGSYVVAAVLALAAITLGGIQLAIDGQYAGGFGRTPVETWLQAMQGVAGESHLEFLADLGGFCDFERNGFYRVAVDSRRGRWFWIALSNAGRVGRPAHGQCGAA